MMGRYGYGYDMMGGYGWAGNWLMVVFGALVVAGIVLLIIWAVRTSGGHHPTQHDVRPPTVNTGHEDAIAIAKRRLANGEITAAQYDEIVRTLNS